jgi:hypothetical protein
VVCVVTLQNSRNLFAETLSGNGYAQKITNISVEICVRIDNKTNFIQGNST